MPPRAIPARRSIGLGFLPDEARHGFLIHIPRGTARADLICISEHRGGGIDALGMSDQTKTLSPADSSMRVVIDRLRWNELAPAFWEEANRRLRTHGLPAHRLPKNASQPVPVHPSLGKELCILCWSVEEATPGDIPNALRNWDALAPEERWWLYTMTVATSGQAMQKGIGWRKALRAALADNPFIKGEGLPPRARRDLLASSQLSLGL